MKTWIISLSIVLLVSCSSKQTKVESDSVSTTSFDGHLGVADKPADASIIPSLVTSRAVNPPPRDELKQEVYSLSAIDAPVHEILYRIAEMADYQVDIWEGVSGTLTINAVRQPLSVILRRISEQLDLVVNLSERAIIVRPDRAYWHEYAIDYVNIRRSSQNTISMNMTVGGAVNPQSGGQAGSSSTVEITSEHDFWAVLESSLTSLVAPSSIENISGSNDVSETPAPVSPDSGQTRVITNPEAGIVLVYATDKQQIKVQNYIQSTMKRTERQVMIEASVVEVVLSENHQSGIDWNVTGFGNILATAVGQGTLTTGVSTNLAADFGFGIRALEEFGDVKVLSSPKIMAVNNQPALLKVVDNEVYFTVEVSRSTSTAGTDITYATTVHTVPVGFMMTVTPFVSDSNQITLNIRPTISRIIGQVRDPNPDLSSVNVESFIPVVQEREMETVLRLRNNQTAVIGGLIEDRTDRRNSGLPWLAKVPFLGSSLFGNRERGTYKTELVVFIRPVIVDKPDVEQGDLSHYRPFLEAQTGARR
jgi:general secretion pathway protein D